MAGKAVPVIERTQQGFFINIDSAHFAHHQSQQHLVAGGMQHATASLITRTESIIPMIPTNVIYLSALGVITVVL